LNEAAIEYLISIQIKKICELRVETVRYFNMILFKKIASPPIGGSQ